VSGLKAGERWPRQGQDEFHAPAGLGQGMLNWSGKVWLG